jgi:hypothetical protein
LCHGFFVVIIVFAEMEENATAGAVFCLSEPFLYARMPCMVQGVISATCKDLCFPMCSARPLYKFIAVHVFKNLFEG